ncbi:hypothetical protein H9Y04_32785 [Streptomyces sp. TRM66268-LWL]|uniref:L,D-transpeptidase n=1 Tax=Streptomyces polyasparticus TaxID=2767826 RepID=A0ABR7SPA2_9ACTN|nr:hypothetical protein [Streptomyces polyasparticus]MBC9717315.1 hypothetical protein [Streptomyces polyasparticus]
MARSSSGFVAGLTAAALAAVGFLAYQASASAPDTLGKPKTPTTSASTSQQPGGKTKPDALPAQSGQGERVVYSLGSDRVWLVGEGNKVTRTFKVTPSTVDPLPGEYAVTTRSGSITGSDGVAIEHVVRFASNDGVTIGFSAAQDGSTPKPDPSRKTGGIRESREDGRAMWEFATVGTSVVVVD